MISIKRIMGMAKKEALQIRRDKVVLRIPIMMPIIWLFLLSYAFVIVPTNLELTIVDEIGNAFTQDIIVKLKDNENILISEKEKDMETGNRILMTDSGEIRLELNGVDLINSRALEGEVKKSLATSSELDVEYSFNTMENTNLFVIPGIIGLVLQNIVTFLTAISIVKEKEKGTYNQLLFSPINFIEIIIGKIIPYFLIGMFDLLVLSVLTTFFFDVNVLGHIVPYLMVGILFILSSLMLGILISSISRNQMQSLLFTIFLLLPSILLSNFVFPVQSMPLILRYFSAIMPLTHFNELSKGILVQNMSLGSLYLPMFYLLIIIFVTISLSVIVLKRNRRI